MDILYRITARLYRPQVWLFCKQMPSGEKKQTAAWRKMRNALAGAGAKQGIDKELQIVIKEYKKYKNLFFEYTQGLRFLDNFVAK